MAEHRGSVPLEDYETLEDKYDEALRQRNILSDTIKRQRRELSQRKAERDQYKAERDTEIEEILNAQADLQTALGFYRLNHGRGGVTDIEDRMTRSLARLHRLLDALGKPMYQPATHPALAASLTERGEPSPNISKSVQTLGDNEGDRP